jgi:hypothetical protein
LPIKETKKSSNSSTTNTAEIPNHSTVIITITTNLIHLSHPINKNLSTCELSFIYSHFVFARKRSCPEKHPESWTSLLDPVYVVAGSILLHATQMDTDLL